ncbi:MAG: hypothetical protein ACRCWL_08800, partial [Aeromonas sp.]
MILTAPIRGTALGGDGHLDKVACQFGLANIAFYMTIRRRQVLDVYPVILYAMGQFSNSCVGEERAVIGRLRGIVIEKQPPEVLLEV